MLPDYTYEGLQRNVRNSDIQKLRNIDIFFKLNISNVPKDLVFRKSTHYYAQTRAQIHLNHWTVGLHFRTKAAPYGSLNFTCKGKV